MPSNPYYNRRYFSTHDHLDPHISHALKLFCARNRLRSILDVGAGTGLLVDFLNQHRFQAIGIDKYSKAKNIRPGSATKLPFPKNNFDLVTAISVIEHLTPKESSQFLTEAHRVLKPGGFIFLITPNLASPFRLIKDKNWFAYTDPTHIQYFTPNTLSNLLVTHGFNYPSLRFAIDPSVKFTLHLPGFLRWLPGPLNYFLTYLLISSPLSTCRDSFWISAQKKP